MFLLPAMPEHPVKRVTESKAMRSRREFTDIMSGIQRYASGFSKSNHVTVKSFRGSFGE